MKMYRPPSVRNFKLFIGELTAEAAAGHVSLLESMKFEADEPNYWSQKANEAGIRLDGIKSDRILKSQIRISVVSIYSGFDVFLEEIEAEYTAFGLEWVKPDKVSPMVVLEKNLKKTAENKTHFRYETDVIDYFRLLRNSIAHPSEENKRKASDFYKSKSESIGYIKSKYKMLSAPNEPSEIMFHDLKLMCQLLLDFSESVAQLLEPEESQIFLTKKCDQICRMQKTFKHACANVISGISAHFVRYFASMS
jgi:hypothetical protein